MLYIQVNWTVIGLPTNVGWGNCLYITWTIWKHLSLRKFNFNVFGIIYTFSLFLPSTLEQVDAI
jgi:hypothetical protein